MASQWLQTDSTRIFGERLDVVVGECYTSPCIRVDGGEGSDRDFTEIGKLPRTSPVIFVDSSTLQRLSDLHSN